MNDKEIRNLQKRLTAMKAVERGAWDMVKDIPRDSDTMEELARLVRMVVRLAHAEQVWIAELLGDNMMKDVRKEGGE